MKKKLILLHGALGDESDFNPLKVLLQNNVDVYSFNFSGHGNLSGSEKDFSISQFTQDLSDFLKNCNIQNCSLFGYSMGGYVALNFSSHFKSGIIIENIITLGTKLHWTPEFSEQQRKFLVAEKLALKVPDLVTQLKKKHGENNWADVVRKTASMMQDLGNHPLLTEDSFKKTDSRCLIAVGELDNMVTVEESKNAVALLKNAMFRILPKTPHPLEKLNVEMLAEEIISFIR
jgi:pimeloyl-ACP methyl ester carboxylesterase